MTLDRLQDREMPRAAQAGLQWKRPYLDNEEPR